MDLEFKEIKDYKIKRRKIKASCPSNIAIIKYWGKYENQIPANPSISYTLNHCCTHTELEFFPNETFQVETFLSGIEKPDFSKKIEKYFRNIETYLPWILKGRYVLSTENTFPHSSGIASSASGFGVLSKCLMELDEIFSGKIEENNNRKASFLARLGSGSACRSLYDGLVVWGETEDLKGTSDLFAIPYPKDEIHPVFKDFNDWVLLIHEGEKQVSSTVGHQLMDNNPYAKRRFQEARENFKSLKKILKEGDLEAFIQLTEHEALTLHAMMMVSHPAFILMKSGTLEAIHKIWNFRKETGLPLFFTLDAGANVHLLFPNIKEVQQIKYFIENELLPLSQNGRIVKDEMKF